ncbi:hypothetical protein [Anoxynatronum buryatiense]|uniref:DUF4179 domain-containing protein n=1 Tax=Anoxynatronum buryatiense TaxID=489973 RepID=A0AA45WY34_9CLOT|nr:hypothetical protein [Anoxynatronum buryatiense]SMP65151.1 hypothetical protein SAMN06296020_11271 [Anoxynatronum buryatiense]
MTEKQIQTLMQQLDNDLLAEEFHHTLGDLDIDVDAISQKTFAKLKKERLKMKRKRMYPLLAASLVAVVCVSSVYASDISDFVKSFFPQKAIYSTVVAGEAFYLDTPLPLNESNKLETVMFTETGLEMTLTFPLAEDKLPEITVVTEDGHHYKPGGYGYEGDHLLLSFWNETDENYIFFPTNAFELIIEENSYAVRLTEGTSVVNNGEIKPAEETTIDWIRVGYQKTDHGVHILTNFDDPELRLVNIGEPMYREVTQMFKNENGIIGSATSPMTHPLLGYDDENNVYTYSLAQDAVGRPITQFEAQVPDGKKINLKIPSLIVGYQKTFDSFNVNIPEINEEVTIDREIDLNLQKMVLQSIKRTSATTAELVFGVNTGGSNEVTVRDVDFYSEDVFSGESVWQGNTCTMTITFEEDLTSAAFNASWPTFEVKGDWEMMIE